MTRLAIVAAVLLAGGLAHADGPAPAPPGLTSRAEPPTQVISVPLWSLQQLQGLSVEYERELSRPHYSVAGVAGVRDAADGDYSSIRLSLGAELRYWFRAGALRGWYVGAGLDLARSSVTDEIEDRQIGSTLVVAESLSLGYRFVPWRRLELTPSIGFGVLSEFDLGGRLPVWHRGTVTTGLTAGWMF